MEKINDGGPAFPARKYNDSDLQGEPTIYMPGMSLRDYFAGQALIGLLAFPHSHRDTRIDTFAENAVAYADALIAELAKESTHE